MGGRDWRFKRDWARKSYGNNFIRINNKTTVLDLNYPYILVDDHEIK